MNKQDQFRKYVDLRGAKDQMAKEAFGMTKGEAQVKGVCINCKSSVFFDVGGPKVPGNIYSPAGVREYGISGYCEHCYDTQFDLGDEAVEEEDDES